MDINKYIDDVVLFLFKNGIYDINDDVERNRIEEKVKRLKNISSSDDEYKNMSFEEKKHLVDTMLNDILTKHAALIENNDPIRKKYACVEGEIGYGKTLLEKKSLTTGEDLEIAYCTIGKGSIHLHCGISRKIDYVDSNGEEITHYHALLRNLKQFISQKYGISEKKEVEKICFERIIKPYIIETLQNAVELCEKYPNLKTIRLDTNDGFFRHVSPVLTECGFEILDENDIFHMKELSIEFPQYKFPDDLTKFYQDYPDRKNSVTIHKNDLKMALENNRNLGFDSLYLKEDVISSKKM